MEKHMKQHVEQLLACRLCSEMVGRPVHGCVSRTRIISVGQAPGVHEERFMKPFAYTAGKTLFKWFATIGIEEAEFRDKVNMSAVCRCFPGKAKSGDRKPNREEIENCNRFLKFEIQYHKPKLIIPIGRLAIDQFYSNTKYKMNDVIGESFSVMMHGIQADCIPLPHPSGLNVWNNTNTGKRLIEKALNKLASHTTIRSTFSI